MKKLRAIQERLGQVSIPNDLRGVGKSPILTELPPCPYLIVDGVDEKVLHDLQANFQVRVVSQQALFVLESSVKESFKHQGLRLWYAARYLLTHHPKVRLQLGERALLREVLEANIDQHYLIHPDVLRRQPVPVALHAAGSFAVSPLQQLVLAQIGYPLQAVEQDLILHHGDPLFKHELTTTQPAVAAV